MSSFIELSATMFESLLECFEFRVKLMYIIKDVIKSHSFDLIELESVLLTFSEPLAQCL